MRMNHLLGTAIAVILAASLVSVPVASAKKKGVEELDETRLIIEFNETDEDVGVQFFIDADGWKSLRVFDPAGKEIFDARTKGRLLDQGGVAELFVESDEPTLADLPLDVFLERFPEGTYTFAGRTVDGANLTGEAEFSHDIPAGPEITLPVVSGDECATNVAVPVVVTWNAVTETIDGDPIDIEAYEVIVEGDELDIDVVMPAGLGTTLTVPAEPLEPGTEYDLEVLAIADNGNQTITETCFVTAD
jgi:hypothetical protein